MLTKAELFRAAHKLARETMAAHAGDDYRACFAAALRELNAADRREVAAAIDSAIESAARCELADLRIMWPFESDADLLAGAVYGVAKRINRGRAIGEALHIARTLCHQWPFEPRGEMLGNAIEIVMTRAA